MKLARSITLRGRSFVVLDTEGTHPDDSWDFWGHFASGQWEHTTISTADRLLQAGDRMFDIGAWVGPLTLWEASRGVKVVAVEPDPQAFVLLQEHVTINGYTDLVTPVFKAVNNGISDKAILHMQGMGGNAYSSLTRTEFAPGVSKGAIFVPATTIEELCEEYGYPKVVKIDIEGGESLVFPQAGPFLRQHRIDVLLALHYQWYAPDTQAAMAAELAQWQVHDLFNDMFWLRV